MNYEEFLSSKEFKNPTHRFEPVWLPEFLFDFQTHIDNWAIRKGRGAIFADCGLGKSPIELVWAENILRKHKNSKVLLLTPIAVSHQFVREGNKFDIKVHRTTGDLKKGINTTNYEQLHKFNPKDFIAVVADESSILKHEDAKTRKLVTEFMRHVPYRLLGTATPAPNDFMELGTSAEALGQMTYNQMLGMFFTHKGETTSQWMLKDHAKKRFWQWVSTWAIAMRKPSDLGYDDGKFLLPKLNVLKETIRSKYRNTLIAPPAITLQDLRDERKATLKERCEKVAEFIPTNRPCLCWCHLNAEGDYLAKIIPDAIQVSGADRDEIKEKKLIDFSEGRIRVLITKPRIGGFGMNWQHCSDVTYFPSFSFEAYYQCIRRCWRFGQKREVNVHIVGTERESIVVGAMIRKERQAEELYSGIVREMSDFQLGKKVEKKEMPIQIVWPEWL